MTGQEIPDTAPGEGEDPQILLPLAQRIVELGSYCPELSNRAERLVERIAVHGFHIAILGEFKRGKSTLVNALIGRSLLPTGVLPLTMVPTEIHFGSSETAVVFTDGQRRAISPGEISHYGTETHNPQNHRKVQRIEVGIEAVFGAPGLVLVDTPGVASVNEHNTAAAHDALIDADAAVMVFSADSPMSESEQALVAELGRRRATVFAVINKADHLEPGELGAVRTFVTEHLRRLLGRAVEPYCVAARPALDAARGLGPETELTKSFQAFRTALSTFVANDLEAARSASAIDELTRLGAALAESVLLEEAAASLDLDKLTTQVARFEAAAKEGSRQLAEDGILLDHDVTRLAKEVGQELADQAARAADGYRPMLETAAAALQAHQLEIGMQDIIEHVVRDGFEPLRRTAQHRAECAWATLAARFGSRVQERVDQLRAVAGMLFDVHMPTAPVPDIRAQRDHFSYHFLHIESPGAFVGRSARLLLPARHARRRALRRAERKLAEEFDKHAGRARYDIAQRLDEAKRHFVADMNHEFTQTQSSILDAAGRARANWTQTESAQLAQREQRSRARSIIDDIAGAVGRPTPAPEAGLYPPSGEWCGRSPEVAIGDQQNSRSDLTQ